MKFIRLTAFIVFIFTMIFSLPCFASEGAIKVLPDSSVVIQIINFLILVLLLNILLYKPIRRILVERKERVEGLEKSAESAIAEAETSEKTFAEKIKEARVKGLKKKEGLIAEAQEQEKKLVEEISGKAHSEMAEVKSKIAKDIEVVRKSLENEVDSFAKAMGEKILGRAV